jgi:phenylpropionate dioxygenase-like ring-hydroxylating dioxygenase large terminal subunit
VPEKGSYIVHDIPFLNASVLVVHGDDGAIRAFHNVCTHRGNKLCQKFADKSAYTKTGRRKFMVCEFHGWVFDTKGSLVDIPDFENFKNIDVSKMGLKPVNCDTWEGFVFVNLADKPEWTLKDQLGELVEELAGYPFGEYVPIFGYEGEAGCNWKLSVDSQIEAYHAATLHRRTLGNSLGGEDNPYIHCLDYKKIGRNQRLSMPAGEAPDRGPIDTLASKYSPSIRSYKMGRLTDFPKGVNPTRSDRWAADIYFIFPNFWIALFDGQYQTHNFWPLDVDRLYQRITMRGQAPSNAAEEFANEYARIMSSNVWMEDFSTLEDCQYNMKSGVLRELHLQDEEVLCRNFHAQIREAINE